MRSRAALWMLLLLVVPFGAPGARGGGPDPQIVDGADDVPEAWPAATTVGAPEIDLTAVWLGADATTFTVAWQVVDATHRVQLDESRLFWASCRSGEEDVLVSVVLAAGGQGGSLAVGHADGTASRVALLVEVHGNVITATGPRAILPTDATCTATRAASQLQLHVPSVLANAPAVQLWRDAAPDAGYGNDATFA